jgi:hypothetical protein
VDQETGVDGQVLGRSQTMIGILPLWIKILNGRPWRWL